MNERWKYENFVHHSVEGHVPYKDATQYSEVVVVVCLFIRFLSVDQSSRSGSR